MNLHRNVFIIILVLGIVVACTPDRTGEQFFIRNTDGERKIPFGGRSECLPFENYTPPDDCPDE